VANGLEIRRVTDAPPNRFAKEARVTLIDCCALSARRQGLLAAGLCLSALSPAAAQDKFVAADTTYTATADNTMNSHYRIDPTMEVPANWKVPVDYSTATVSVRMEVLEKPSNAKTLVNVCFQGNVETCMAYPPAYSMPGVLTFSKPLNSFWQYGMFDWTKGIQYTAVSLKDEDEQLVQGDPMFYPTKVKLTVTVTADDAPVMEPEPADAGMPRDAGMGMGRRDAGQIPTGPNTPGVAGRAAPIVDAGVPLVPTSVAGSRAPAAVGGRGGAPSVAGTGAPSGVAGGRPERKVGDYLESDTGCSTLRVRAGADPLWALLPLLGSLMIVRRSQRRRCGVRAG
jgi:hypothetical protein